MKQICGVLLCVLTVVSLCACGQPAGEDDASALSWQEQYDLGIRYLSEGKNEEAIIAFTAAIEIDSKKAIAYVGRGDAYIHSGENEENLIAAQSDYEAAIELDEAIVEAYLGLADVYIRQGEFSKAKEVLEIALEETQDQRISEKLAEFESGSITDSDGYARREMFFNGDGTLLFYVVNRFPDGLMDISTYDPDGKPIAHGQEVRDAHGNPVEYFCVDSRTGKLMQTKCQYDDAGNLIVYEDYDSDGTRAQRREIFYDEQGRQTREYYWHSDDERPRYVFEYIYDGSGNIVEARRYHSSMIEYYGIGELLDTTKNSYDVAGNKTEAISYDADGNQGGRWEWEYDSFGNETASTYWASSGDVYRDEWVFEYDENGNIISKISKSFVNGELTHSEER